MTIFASVFRFISISPTKASDTGVEKLDTGVSVLVIIMLARCVDGGG